MSFKAKVRSLLLTEHDQIYLEALLLVIGARVAIACCFRLIAPWVLAPQPEGGDEPGPVLQQQVQMALESVGRWMPWEMICLANAIAAKFILQRRGFKSTIHLGVNYKSNGSLRAHAWLESGGTVLVGGESTDTVTQISR